jgi:hypothetical protein
MKLFHPVQYKFYATMLNTADRAENEISVYI